MLYKDKITANFCIINYILKEIKYTEGFRRKISDSEIITIAFIVTISYYGNHYLGLSKKSLRVLLCYTFL